MGWPVGTKLTLEDEGLTEGMLQTQLLRVPQAVLAWLPLEPTLFVCILLTFTDQAGSA